MKNRGVIFLIVFLLFFQNVVADITYTRTFVNQTGGSVNNVQVVGYICPNTACTSVSGPIWSNQPLTTGSTNTITLVFPATPLYPSGGGYLVRFFANGYVSKKTPNTGNTPFLATGTTTWTTTTTTFNKHANCGSQFSISASNKIAKSFTLRDFISNYFSHTNS
jgi:hypothetical protein